MKCFDIVWSSIKDGPGKRVVLFLQGCPLHCEWCHSPHSQPMEAPVLFYKEYCSNCGMCRTVCQKHCFENDHGKNIFDRSACVMCGRCVLNCAQGALAYNLCEGTSVEIFEKIKLELKLLKNIGGLTLTGGEPMLQYVEAKELLKKCKEIGVHTAVETSGAVDPKSFEKLINYVDCWLFGLKQTDVDKCFAMTGSDYNIIRQNLNYIANQVPDKIIIRTPLIEGFTDDIDNIQNISQIMLSLGLNKIELLPYNPHTSHYYLAMGKDFDEHKFKLPSQNRIQNIIEIFESKGIHQFSHINL